MSIGALVIAIVNNSFTKNSVIQKRIRKAKLLMLKSDFKKKEFVLNLLQKRSMGISFW